MLSGTMVNSSLQNPGGASPEQQLIRRVQDGERELFYELVRPYERRVYTAAFAILRNEARMRLRRDRSKVIEPIVDHPGEEGNYTPRDFADWREIPSETAERNEIREKLLEALASLGAKYREVFMLRDVRAPGLGGSWNSRLSFVKGKKPW